jgi:CTP synthase
MACKYIFVTGGVVSGLGKGITAASLGRLLINRGLRVTCQKLDPYINVDPGTMNPCEHGEVWVTDDGAETDLDIGHYERFLGQSFTKFNSCTSGQIYNRVITKERAGEFLGRTIQVIPHITNEIIDTMKCVAENNDIVIVEVGGTVGDMEQMAFIESIRQFRRELGANNSLSIHVTLVPFLNSSGEIKTLPTRHSVQRLAESGVFADIVVARTNADITLDEHTRRKIAMFCGLENAECVIHNPDCASIYAVPKILKEQKMDDIVLQKLQLTAQSDDLKNWNKMVEKMLNPKCQKTVAIVGKYTSVPDAYMSVTEATKHAGFDCGVGVKIKLVDCEKVEKNGAAEIGNVDAIIVPGGFGDRGIEGKILAINHARTKKIPFLGICLGMQMAVVEFARNVLKLTDANSTEINPNTSSPVIDILPEQIGVTQKGGTMRLGAYDCTLQKGTLAAELYKSKSTSERHRHRYELNNWYREKLTNAGLIISGINEKLDLCEIVELPSHPYFIAGQFHPEFKSRPYAPHPLFVGLINAILKGGKGK